MKHVRAALLAGLTLTAASAGAFAPAHAGTTDVTFTLSAGLLSISAPTTVQNLGTASVSLGDTTSAAFSGPVTVTDDRGMVTAKWTATVSSTDFTGTTHAKVLSKSQGAYSTGTITASTGLVVTPTIGATMAIDSTLAGAGTGSNSASWTPTVAITVPTGAVADTYTGTVTHSVT